MNILIITDAWAPQVNGVVRTYENLIKEIEKYGHKVTVYHPKWLCFANGSPTNYWKMIRLPFYKEIELMWNPEIYRNYILGRAYFGDKIHIATEGPLGLYAKRLLDKEGLEYTTSYHTRFPEYLSQFTKLPAKFFYPYFRWFHKKSKCVMVPTQGMIDKLKEKGFKNLALWTRGTNHLIFNPKFRQVLHRPYIVCVSRISREKNLDEFCKLPHPHKVLVGDGPYLKELRKKYPYVEYKGKLTGASLAKVIASADAFVFPSKTDTFGIVLLEAIACGTPVLAYAEPGPLEVIEEGVNGCLIHFDKKYGLHGRLEDKLQQTINLSRDSVHFSAKKWTWEASALDFLDNMK